MRKSIVTTIGLTLFFTILIITFSTLGSGGKHSAYAFSGGSPGGKTNSPGDVNNCTQCHAGTMNTGIGVATITAPDLALGYVTGQTYTITASVTENDMMNLLSLIQ